MMYRISLVCDREKLDQVIVGLGPVVALSIEHLPDDPDQPAPLMVDGTIRECTLRFLRNNHHQRWSTLEIAGAIRAKQSSVSGVLTGLIEDRLVRRYAKNSYGAR